MEKEEVEKMITTAVAAAVTATEVPLKARITSLESEVATFRTKDATQQDTIAKQGVEIKNLKDAETERVKSAEKASVQLKREAIKVVFEDAVKAKVITPGQRDAEYALLNLSSDEATVRLYDSIDTLKEKYKVPEKKTNVKQFKQGETARSGSDSDLPEGRTHQDPHKEVIHRIEGLRRADSKLSYSMAKRQVLSTDPDLAREYLDNPASATGGK